MQVKATATYQFEISDDKEELEEMYGKGYTTKKIIETEKENALETMFALSQDGIGDIKVSIELFKGKR